MLFIHSVNIILVPKRVDVPDRVIQISAGYDSSFFICENGSIYACGCNRSNKLGLCAKKSIIDIFTNKPNQVHMKDKPTPVKIFSTSQRIRQVSQEMILKILKF